MVAQAEKEAAEAGVPPNLVGLSRVAKSDARPWPLRQVDALATEGIALPPPVTMDIPLHARWDIREVGPHQSPFDASFLQN